MAKSLDLTETALRDWVKRTEADAGRGLTGALTTVERSQALSALTLTHRAIVTLVTGVGP